MAYKKWAQDGTWLKQHLTLKSIPEGVPALIPPKLGGNKPVDLDELEAKIRQIAHRMSDKDIAWWSSFVKNENVDTEMWKQATPKQLEELGKANWPLNIVKKYNSASENKKNLKQKNSEGNEKN